jgi:hypothetical protein
MGYRRFFRPVMPNYSLPHPGVRQIRYFIFLKDILILALTPSAVRRRTWP